MNRLLSKLGLMRVSEHERVCRKISEIGLTARRTVYTLSEAQQRTIIRLEEEVSSLLPDALAMRRKRQMDRDRRANNRKGKDNG